MPPNGAEQLSLSRLIEVTVDDFDHSLKGWQFTLLALHSRVEPDYLVRLLSKNRNVRLFDERRRLSRVEESKRNYLEEVAEQSSEYAAWIWERDFEPLHRDLLVAQCVGFENFLKTLGVASKLSATDSYSLEKLIFVPSEEFRKAHKVINKWWKDAVSVGRASRLVETYLVNNRAISAAYSGWERVDLAHWGPIWDEIFRLRNAIVHSRGRPSEQVELASEIFSPFDEAIVTEHTLRAVDKAFRIVVNAFRITLDDV